MNELLLKDEVYTIIGAAIEVHRELGSRFLELVYQEALELELESRRVPFKSQQSIAIRYNEHQLKQSYFANFLGYNQIVVELKALAKLTGREESQLIHYLTATGLRVGLLVNLGSVGRLEWKRYFR
jgi:GxxExxY protein